MGIILVILGSTMIIVGACLIWRASVILQRFLHQEKLEVSLAGMVEELEATARSGVASIEAERRKVEQLLAGLMQQVGTEKEAAMAMRASEDGEPNKAAAAARPSVNQVEDGTQNHIAVTTPNHVADQTSVAGSTSNHRRYETVWRLQDEGVAACDIARQLGMGRGEVELIQGLRNYYKSDDGAASDKS